MGVVMAPPPGVRPRVHIHGLGLALTIGVMLWAVAVLAGWIAFSLFGIVGVIAFAACLVYVWVCGMGWL